MKIIFSTITPIWWGSGLATSRPVGCKSEPKWRLSVPRAAINHRTINYNSILLILDKVGVVLLLKMLCVQAARESAAATLNWSCKKKCESLRQLFFYIFFLLHLSTQRAELDVRFSPLYSLSLPLLQSARALLLLLCHIWRDSSSNGVSVSAAAAENGWNIFSAIHAGKFWSKLRCVEPPTQLASVSLASLELHISCNINSSLYSLCIHFTPLSRLRLLFGQKHDARVTFECREILIRRCRHWADAWKWNLMKFQRAMGISSELEKKTTQLLANREIFFLFPLEHTTDSWLCSNLLNVIDKA